jgi:tetratricopeptide (TPR) repeat protein
MTERHSLRSLPRAAWVLAAVLAGTLGAIAPQMVKRTARPVDRIGIDPLVGMPGGPRTSAAGLRNRIGVMEARLREQSGDVGAAVLLADALLRLARATSDGRATNHAEQVLTDVLKESPAQYDALRMLGAVYLSQHRFRDGLGVARKARNLRPNDSWNYGVMGDALIELGEYDQAFEAFETMISMRPHAAAYARVAYGRELRGDLAGAAEAMQMAAEATNGQDSEAQAWYAAQLGELYLRMQKLDEAGREYRRAAFLYPDYPLAMIGQGKVRVARGDRDGALEIYLAQLKRTPTLDLAGRIGDLYAERGDAANSERYYELAEDVAGPAAAQTEANLALFLAEHGRKLPDAVRIAEMVGRKRRDIFTDDALAWAYYKVGRFQEARAASERAMRTGTRDERIVSHAARIHEAAARDRG